MAKKHVHKWGVWVGPARVEPQAICQVEGCGHKLSALQIERILNQRRPKYRKATRDEVIAEHFHLRRGGNPTLYARTPKGTKP
jgi:hypothetical protein